MSLLSTNGSSGERRRWTLKEIVQGKPIGHPSHAMFVHFPVALYIGALGLDIVSRAGHLPQAPLAATWLILGAFAGSLLAVPTGLVDWWGMKPGSRTRKIANKHLLLQLGTAAIFVVNTVLRWSHRYDPRAHALWIVLGAIGVVTLTLGQYFGGVLVYRIGFRVYGERSQPKPAVSERVGGEVQ
jgi:uncharacterized membrane protein